MLNSRIEKFFFVFAFSLMFACTAAAQLSTPPGAVLTLDQAIASAVENSRLLKIAALENRKIEDRIAATLTRRRPTSNFSFLGAQTLTELNFSFKQGQFGQYPTTGPIPAQDTQIGSSRRLIGLAMAQIDQPITQLSRINLAASSQKLEIEANDEKIRQQRHEIVNHVRQIYYQILLKEVALEASDESSRQYAELDRTLAVSLAQDAVLRLDTLEVKALIAQEDYKKTTIRNAIEELKETLNRLMGRDLATPFRTQGMGEVPTMDVDLATAQARAVSQRPEIKQGQIRIRQADYDRLLKKSENTPDLSLVLRYISPIHAETLPKNILAVGFNFSWQPWDWGRKKAELSEKVRAIDQARESLAETESQILAEVRQRYRKLDETRAAFRVIQAGQEAARERVRVVQQQYNAQTVLLKDVLQSQVSLAEVNSRYQQSLLAYWAAKADFEKSIGADQ
jgi:outer membrane protein